MKPSPATTHLSLAFPTTGAGFGPPGGRLGSSCPCPSSESPSGCAGHSAAAGSMVLMASTLDSESSDLSSSLRRTCLAWGPFVLPTPPRMAKATLARTAPSWVRKRLLFPLQLTGNPAPQWSIVTSSLSTLLAEWLLATVSGDSCRTRPPAVGPHGSEQRLSTTPPRPAPGHPDHSHHQVTMKGKTALARPALRWPHPR